MKQETRNKIALVLFCFLFALGGGLLLLYVYLGHNWNFAATEIDEASGYMEEYLVVMFDGTTDPLLVASQKASDEDLPGFRQGDVSLGSDDLDAILNQKLDEKYGPVPIPEPESEPESASSSETTTTSTSQGSSSAPAEATPGAPGEADSVDESSSANVPGETNSPGEADAVDEGFERNNTDSENAPKKDLGNAYASYVGKNADVLPLYTKNPEYFSEGVIYIKGSYHVGVLGLERPIATQELQDRVDALREAGANVILFVGPYKNIISGISGIDIMIVTQGSTGELQGHQGDEAYIVEASVVGTVDAVIVSPNHVMSVKRITRF